MKAILRPIRREDDPRVAEIIRTVMPEFGASGEGFAIHDAEVDAMFEAYTRPRSGYFVVELGPRVVGGAGIAPLEGGDPDTCELKKMYFLEEARGRGIGRQLIELCLVRARELSFRNCYIETLDTMVQAKSLYEKVGFRRLGKPMGNTGHFSCDTWYLLELPR